MSSGKPVYLKAWLEAPLDSLQDGPQTGPGAQRGGRILGRMLESEPQKMHCHVLSSETFPTWVLEMACPSLRQSFYGLHLLSGENPAS